MQQMSSSIRETRKVRSAANIPYFIGIRFVCCLDRSPRRDEQPSTALYVASWNIVPVGSLNCVVDLLFDPGMRRRQHGGVGVGRV